MSDHLHVRRVSASDDLHALTELIHAAYAPHAASGLRYWATHQSVADTEKRIARGVCFVGELGGEIIATINEQAFSSLDAPITRLAPPDIPIPYNLKLMDAVIPSVALIRNEIEKLLRY